MSQTRTRSDQLTTTALPHRYEEEGLEFEISSYSLDGGKPRDVEDRTDAVIELGTDTEEWESGLVFGTISLPQDLIDHVFPEAERDAPPARLVLAIRCHETILRDRHMVTEAPIDAGAYDFKVRIPRSRVRGEVSIVPYLVRTESRESDDGGYASEPNLRVASAPGRTIVVDPSELEGESVIDGAEASFESEDHLPGPDSLYYLDIRDPAEPKLWINSDNPRIVDVLHSRGTIGARARMRDVILDEIAYGVWTQLFLRAGSDVQPDGSVPHEWQETVLDIFAPRIYGVNDTEQALRELKDDLGDPTRLQSVMQEFDLVIQDFLDPRRQLLNLMEEGLQL